MERLSFNVARRASRTNPDPSGIVRVAVTEGPGLFWILPRLIDFQKTYRRITVDLQCAMQQADVSRLETDISIQLTRPTAPDLIVAKLARLHIHPFVSRQYFERYGVPTSKDELSQHRYVSQNAPAVDEFAFARISGITSLEGIVSIRTNSSTAVLYAVERGAGIGFLPTCSIALGAPLVALEYDAPYFIDLWLTYHAEFKKSERHRIVIDWLRRIFDPVAYPCFRDEFIHPNDLIRMLEAQRENYGLEGFRAAIPD
jgi:DNA-binding transcriptional LysR family regulator